jgi:hypothetical protein
MSTLYVQFFQLFSHSIKEELSFFISPFRIALAFCVSGNIDVVIPINSGSKNYLDQLNSEGLPLERLLLD